MSTIVLTSDFPSTGNEAVVDLIKGSGPNPRVAWIPPQTRSGHERFPAACAAFRACGVVALEFCDIDEAPNEEQLRALPECDVVYLSGGDPIAFRRNLLRTGLGVQLRECFLSDGVIVAASGGAMQFTQSVSLFRLLTSHLEEVLATHGEYDGLGFVPYELLPHLNRFDPSFIEAVRRYSERVAHDVLALSDSAAIVHTDASEQRVLGQAARFRRGVMTMVQRLA